MDDSNLHESATVEPSNLVIFICGGADKTKKCLAGSYLGATYLMRDARDYFVSKQGPYSKALYFGYLGPGTFKNHADIVVLIGGQYGGRLEPHATIHKELKIGHGKVIPPVTCKIR